ncbi:MAG TPA: VCBS repeat-containing protein, partial [Bacteroidetes bacterium]|nr:VCBS repeat-containing protein [Bacteroidota bacterium]
MIKEPDYRLTRPGTQGIFLCSRLLFVRVTRSLCLFAFLFFSGNLFGQEICNNGIDDDLDGYIDCFDSDCANFQCDSAFLGGPVPTCQLVPPMSSFQMQLAWTTNSITHPMDNRQTAIVGDLDGDGFPEVIGKHHDVSNSLYIFDGVTGGHKQTINTPPMDLFLDSPCIGDIDQDGFGEILVVSEGNLSTRRLYCFEHTGAIKWVSSAQIGYTPDHDRWSPHLADFNEDGVPEVYLGNQIFNGTTGQLIASGGPGASFGAFSATSEPFPVAVDVLPNTACANCSGLELVCGNTVYSVNIGT